MSTRRRACRAVREAGWLASLFVAVYWLIGAHERAFEAGRRWGRIEGEIEALRAHMRSRGPDMSKRAVR